MGRAIGVVISVDGSVCLYDAASANSVQGFANPGFHEMSVREIYERESRSSDLSLLRLLTAIDWIRLVSVNSRNYLGS